MNNRYTDREAQKLMIISDKIWKVILNISWPAILALILYGLNSVFDAIFIGQYVGETALAGVSIAYPISQMTIGIGSLIGAGAGSALSIALGGNDKNTQRSLLPSMNFLIITLSITYGILTWFFAEMLIELMGGQGEALQFGTSYLKVTAIGSIFSVYGLSTNMIIRAEGKMKTAALIMGMGLCVNIFASYIMVGILNIGVIGAAWGTNIGMLAYAFFGITYFITGRCSFEAYPLKIIKDVKVIKRIMSLGISSFLTAITDLVKAAIVFNVLSELGTTWDIAIYGASFRIYTLLETPLIGMMRAQQPIVGINYGAGNYIRVIKSVKFFIFYGIVFLIPIIIVLIIKPQIALSMMIPKKIFNDYILFNFRIFIGIFLVLPFSSMAMTFFPAINKGILASVLVVMRQIVLFIPAILVLPKLLGVRWIYLGSTVIEIIIMIITVVLLIRQFRELKNIYERNSRNHI